MGINKVIISGGGTGGHIYPAISIAQELKLYNQNIEILFVGAKGKMEMEKVPKAGFSIEGLWISGLQRKISFDNFAFPFKLISSIYHSNKIISQFKPDVAVGVGGFASGPLLYAASGRNVPTLIHEQNSYAGLTNKWLSKRVNKICVAYDGMEKFFPAEKIVKTGNPVRQDLLDIGSKKTEAYQFFNFDPNKKTILVLGGSLGARTINQTLASQVNRLTDEGFQVIWQTGKLYFDELKHLNNQQLYITDFIYRMDLAYALSDIILSRAGASSISEIALIEKALILIPSPNVAEDHQTKNAMALVSQHAALMVTDREASEKLVNTCIQLANNNEQITSLKNNIKHFATPHAAKDIVSEILKLVQ